MAPCISPYILLTRKWLQNLPRNSAVQGVRLHKGWGWDPIKNAKKRCGTVHPKYQDFARDLASPVVGGRPPHPPNTNVFPYVCAFPKTSSKGQLSRRRPQTHPSVVIGPGPVPLDLQNGLLGSTTCILASTLAKRRGNALT